MLIIKRVSLLTCFWLLVDGHTVNIFDSDESVDILESSESAAHPTFSDKILLRLEELEGKMTEVNERLDELNDSEAKVPSGCPNGWIRFESSCYLFGEKDLDFNKAQLLCESADASLINIETITEDIFIQNQLRQRKAPRHWIGLTDIGKEGEFRYYPSETLANYINWLAGQPNGGTAANCAAIWDSYLVDDPCTRLYRAICEKR